MRSRRQSLAILSRYESGTEAVREIIDPNAPTDLGVVMIQGVLIQYRPACVLLQSEDDMGCAEGADKMADFIGTMGTLMTQALAEGDEPLAMLAKHHWATAAGRLDRKSDQNAMNQAIIDWAMKIDPDEKDDDVQLVHDRALFGRIENDEKFREEYGLQRWVALVSHAEATHFYGFPGRALQLAKYFDHVIGDLDAADDLLERALRFESAVSGQIEAVKAYMDLRKYRQEA